MFQALLPQLFLVNRQFYWKNQFRMARQQFTKLSENLSLSPCLNQPVPIVKQSGTWIVDCTEQRPLVLLFEYMNAKQKHIDKFIQFYSDRRFDVLTVSLKPWQLFWPVKGSQVVAKEVTEFLKKNSNYSPIIYHGFSVGGYLWGEVLQRFLKYPEKYKTVVNRFYGQIVDSGVDVSEIPTAFPAAVFPDKPFLRSAMEKCISCQMKVFYEQSTKHYIAARAAFTSGIVNAPALLIYSADSDPLSTPSTNAKVVQDYANKNIVCYTKEFPGSKHVMHYQKYPVEYLMEIDLFLSKLNLSSTLVNLKSKL